MGGPIEEQNMYFLGFLFSAQGQKKTRIEFKGSVQIDHSRNIGPAGLAQTQWAKIEDGRIVKMKWTKL